MLNHQVRSRFWPIGRESWLSGIFSACLSTFCPAGRSGTPIAKLDLSAPWRVDWAAIRPYSLGLHFAFLVRFFFPGGGYGNRQRPEIHSQKSCPARPHHL